MKYFKIPIFISIIAFFLVSCEKNYKDIENGVSHELAVERKESISNLKYELFFDLPGKLDDVVSGEVLIMFDYSGNTDLLLDFTGDRGQIFQVLVNGEFVDYIFENEHIIIPIKHLKKGENDINLFFEAPNTSLNRRDDYMYTLLVPDRARTLFPCFDQPNLKAEFSLKLAIPKSWTAIGNGAVSSTDSLSEERKKLLYFDTTAPISTYLFSFVAGKFKKSDFQRNRDKISIYYRESDPYKTAQLEEIFNEVKYSLDYMEAYTNIKYPFQKYDLVILPGFQYGGMEHMGATLYNDNRMFLSEGATINQKLSRSSLIAHETAHMWFGDYVTMDWFDDVWNKEIFANYFAAKITSKLYPQINNVLNFSAYHISSYSEDRTQGSTPISQSLQNLNQAGLVYGKIIYNKAPIVLDMMVKQMGEEAFMNGIRAYLKKYAYSNATWDNLIKILNRYSSKDLVKWSNTWVKSRGVPTIESVVVNDSLFIVQSDPFLDGTIWEQPLSYLVVGDYFSSKISVNLYEVTSAIKLPTGTKYLVPNEDAAGYGFFALDSASIRYCMETLPYFGSDLTKRSVIINLHESLLNSYISPEDYVKMLVFYIPKESNTILYTHAINNLTYTLMRYQITQELYEKALTMLWHEVDSSNKEAHSKVAFQSLTEAGNSKESLDRKLEIFYSGESLPNTELSNDDFTNLSYNLALYFPKEWSKIVSTQLSRIKSPDKISEYKFVSTSLNPDPIIKDSLFNKLLSAKNRQIEPWALKSLSILNHYSKQKEALKYIRPALEIMPEIQKTGDIFLPQNWVNALLKGHSSSEAALIVETYINENQNRINPMLMNKVKQQSDHLFR